MATIKAIHFTELLAAIIAAQGSSLGSPGTNEIRLRIRALE
jgi:hypothetical protein